MHPSNEYAIRALTGPMLELLTEARKSPEKAKCVALAGEVLPGDTNALWNTVYGPRREGYSQWFSDVLCDMSLHERTDAVYSIARSARAAFTRHRELFTENRARYDQATLELEVCYLLIRKCIAMRALRLAYAWTQQQIDDDAAEDAAAQAAADQAAAQALSALEINPRSG